MTGKVEEMDDGNHAEQDVPVYAQKDIDFLASEAERRGVLIHINGLPYGSAQPTDWSGVVAVKRRRRPGKAKPIIRRG